MPPVSAHRRHSADACCGRGCVCQGRAQRQCCVSSAAATRRLAAQTPPIKRSDSPCLDRALFEQAAARGPLAVVSPSADSAAHGALAGGPGISRYRVCDRIAGAAVRPVARRLPARRCVTVTPRVTACTRYRRGRAPVAGREERTQRSETRAQACAATASALSSPGVPRGVSKAAARRASWEGSSTVSTCHHSPRRRSRSTSITT
jgi:hypothetical protein